jgi:hypothetical protein
MDNISDPPITRSYVSSASRIAKSQQLAEWLGINESEVYRQAIDEMYERVSQDRAEVTK